MGFLSQANSVAKKLRLLVGQPTREVRTCSGPVRGSLRLVTDEDDESKSPDDGNWGTWYVAAAFVQPNKARVRRAMRWQMSKFKLHRLRYFNCGPSKLRVLTVAQCVNPVGFAQQWGLFLFLVGSRLWVGKGKLKGYQPFCGSQE